MSDDEPISLGDIDALLAFLEPFEASDFSPGRWVEPKPDPDGTLSFPFFEYSDGVSRFVRALYHHHFVLSFDWPAWADEAKRYVGDPQAVEKANLPTLAKLLTTHVRADRFTEGHLAGMFEQGHILAILRRLKAIRS
jgi:hypothetical protein